MKCYASPWALVSSTRAARTSLSRGQQFVSSCIWAALNISSTPRLMCLMATCTGSAILLASPLQVQKGLSKLINHDRFIICAVKQKLWLEGACWPGTLSILQSSIGPSSLYVLHELNSIARRPAIWFHELLFTVWTCREWKPHWVHASEKIGAFKRFICWLHAASDSAAWPYSTLPHDSLHATASTRHLLNSNQARKCEQGMTCWPPSSWQISAAFLHSCSTRRTSPETPATCINNVFFCQSYHSHCWQHD